MLWFLPLESLESRYTAQMYAWVTEALRKRGTEFRAIVGNPLACYDIGQGQILDICQTINWKSQQIRAVAARFEAGEIHDGDQFLIGDLWFPGLEAIPYMAELMGIRVSIWGWHYAGRADPHDFVQNLGPWADAAEWVWLDMAEGVFVGSLFHKELLVRKWPLWWVDKWHPVGLVFRSEDIRAGVNIPLLEDRPKRVIFPHRGAPEKNPEAFYRLATELQGQGYEFLITSSRKGTPEELGFVQSSAGDWTIETGLTKAEYYDRLAHSRVMFSSAYQETFGYALHEAMALGVAPVVPDRLCYPEALEGNRAYLYQDFADAKELVVRNLEIPLSCSDYFVQKYDNSIDKALDIIEAQ